MQYKLTEYSHGAGCGCKLSPGELSKILGTNNDLLQFPDLIVGNESKDDAAVVRIDDERAIISTTDFFMPIVDDPEDFGAIAAANAISDIYAMGGKPILAIAILGWPIAKIPGEVASQVLTGARKICALAGIALAGGHSIDAPEPIFGLAVTGICPLNQVKKNSDGMSGDLLYLTKPLGIGLVTTAQKRKMADSNDIDVARESMMALNMIGEKLGGCSFVHAMTDVTGFGLGGHLLEVCDAAGVSAVIYKDKLPVFDFVKKYISLDCIPGGTQRNWKTYGHRISLTNLDDYKIIADPQTSGGLLISVDSEYKLEFEAFLDSQGIRSHEIGMIKDRNDEITVLVE